MISFDNLQKANESIQTTDIKGKDYAEVNQRIKAFRMLFPEGFICTDIISNELGSDMAHVCIIKATVGFMNENDERQVLGTGIAYEKENSTFINKTSYIENCETSAVGRALGMCGIGIDTSVASFEEVQTAITNQDLDKPITAAQLKDLEDLVNNGGVPVDYVCSLYGRKRLKDFNRRAYNHVTEGWETLKEKYIARQNG